MLPSLVALKELSSNWNGVEIHCIRYFTKFTFCTALVESINRCWATYNVRWSIYCLKVQLLGLFEISLSRPSCTFPLFSFAVEGKMNKSEALTSLSEVPSKDVVMTGSFSQYFLSWWRIWLTQSCKTGRDFRVGPGFEPGSGRARAGFGLKFVKMFRSDFGSAYKTFCNIRSNDFFRFFSFVTFVVLTMVTSVSKVIVIFPQLFLFANTAALFYFLLGLVSRCFWQRWGNYHAMALRRRDQSLPRFLTCFKKRWPTNRLFMPIALCYSRKFLLCLWRHRVYFRGSFVFSWESLHSAALSLTNKLSLC